VRRRAGGWTDLRVLGAGRGAGEMEGFLPHDVAFEFGAFIQLQIDTGSTWIVPLGIRLTIVADVLAPRGSVPPRRSRRPQGQAIYPLSPGGRLGQAFEEERLDLKSGAKIIGSITRLCVRPPRVAVLLMLHSQGRERGRTAHRTEFLLDRANATKWTLSRTAYVSTVADPGIGASRCRRPSRTQVAIGWRRFGDRA
jgi:hypothetical protein